MCQWNINVARFLNCRSLKNQLLTLQPRSSRGFKLRIPTGSTYLQSREKTKMKTWSTAYVISDVEFLSPPVS